MANDVNTITIVGRLTKDVELAYNNSGTAFTKGSIANGYSKKNGDNWEDETNFFDFTIIGRRGEALNQYLVKGTQIAISGVLRQDRWIDNQSQQQRSKVYILVDNVQLLGGKSNNGQTNSGSNSGSNGYGNNSQGNNSYNNQRSSNNSQGNRGGNNSYNNYPSGGGSGNFEDEIPF